MTFAIPVLFLFEYGRSVNELRATYGNNCTASDLCVPTCWKYMRGTGWKNAMYFFQVNNPAGQISNRWLRWGVFPCQKKKFVRVHVMPVMLTTSKFLNESWIAS